MKHQVNIMKVVYQRLKEGTQTFVAVDNSDFGFQKYDELVLKNGDEPNMQFTVGDILIVEENIAIISLVNFEDD